MSKCAHVYTCGCKGVQNLAPSACDSAATDEAASPWVPGGFGCGCTRNGHGDDDNDCYGCSQAITRNITSFLTLPLPAMMPYRCPKTKPRSCRENTHRAMAWVFCMPASKAHHRPVHLHIYASKLKKDDVCYATGSNFRL